MKPRGALLLLTLAVAAWGSWFLLLREVPGTDERREQAGRLLPGLDTAAVTRVEIERPADRLVLVRDAGSWRVEQPVVDAADAFVVDGLLGELAEASTDTRLAPADVRGGDEATGLGRGAVTVRLERDGAPVAVAFGSVPAPGDRRYARLPDGQLALADPSLVTSLTRPADEFRDRAVVSLAPADVRRARVERAGAPTLVFERRGADGWWIVEPLVDDADDAAAGGIVSRAATLRAERFADPTAPLPPAEATISLFGAAAQEREAPTAIVRIGRGEGDSPERIVTSSTRDARFVVLPGSILAELTKSPDAFRSRLATDASAFDVAWFALERGGVAQRLVRGEPPRDGGDAPWTVDGPAGAKPAPEAVRERLNRLVRIEALRIAEGVTPAEAGLERPVARLTLAGRDAERLPETTLEIGGPAEGGGVYARRSGRPAILVIDRAAAEAVAPLTP